MTTSETVGAGSAGEDAAARELRAAFDGYETALNGNDVDALIDYFWNDPKAVRLLAGGGAYGYEQIANFRRGREISDITRTLTRVDILMLGETIGVANCEYVRKNSGRKGAQSQVWRKFPEGWKIVSAHVSIAPLDT